MPKVLQAFVPAIGLFAGFLVSDELFIVYHRIPSLESSHFLALCALLLSVVVIQLLIPSDQAGERDQESIDARSKR